jgi:GLPGLI family protein
MKKVVTTLMLVSFTLMANAQGMIIDKTQARNTKKAKSDTLTIDQVAYRITYNSKSVTDTTKTPYRYKDDEMRLEIGKNGVSRFYSYTRFLRKQMTAEMIKKGGGIDLTSIPKGGAISWELYKNYPVQGKTLYLDVISLDSYQCEETVETPDWQLVPDSTKEILGYQCQMATTRFKGRQWTVWYTEDIPLDEGPWKLRGLPGLVLSAYDAKRQYVFEGAGLEQVSTDQPVVIVEEKREKISQKNFRKVLSRYDPMAALSSRGIKIISVKEADGSEGKLPTKLPSNSIELE